jgi:DNA/RNA-binding domain of Phe-tRNA-synthetase-like protein
MAGSCSGVLVEVDEAASALGVRVAYSAYEGPAVSSLDPAILDPAIKDLVARLASTYTIDSLKEDATVRAYRDFYWRIGIDPTKTRPSGEALVRRALRGRFPRINPVVDAGNIASASTLVPIGLYDLDKLEPPVRLTVSRGGEEFLPIGGERRILRRGLPILVDSRGLVLHLYPHRDSVYTAVEGGTSRILAVAAGVPGVRDSLLLKALRILGETLSRLGWRSCLEPRVAP